jgi:hypothetical protein
MYLLAAISCQIPESVTLKGSPGVHLPLGSPFALMDKTLEDYIEFDKIKEMMGGEGSNIRVYEYTGEDVDEKVQAYLILYPITGMEFNLQDYIDRIIKDDDAEFTARIPVSITNPPDGYFPPNGYHLTRGDNNTVEEQPVVNQATDVVNPLFTIDLPDMAKLVKEVTSGPFGLELDYQEDFHDHLWISIPDLGIPYIQGSDELIEGERKLRFVTNSSTTLHPQDDFKNNKISIYVIATGPCQGMIEPKMVFEWEEATIDTVSKPISGEYTINNRDLEEFLGGGIAFKNITGYIYADGVGPNAEISLKVAGVLDDLVPNSQLKEVDDHPSFSDPFDQPIPQHSLDEPIDLTNTLNSSTAGAIELEYIITIHDKRIEKANMNEKERIFADLVILLPLEFTVTTPPSDNQQAARFAKLHLKDLFPDPGEKDWFQREDKPDDLFNNLKSVKFILSDLKNEILGGKIYISVLVNNNSKLLDLQSGNPSIEFDMRNLPPPFIPQFEILIEKENSANGAPFWLKRKKTDNAKFDFSLTIQARTDINQTISISGK